MKQGKVCEKHQEFSPDGECRWCEPPAPAKMTFLGMPISPMSVEDFTVGGGPFQIVSYPDPNIGPPRLPLSCKHDGALLDFGGVISCSACGKVLTAPGAPLTFCLP